MNLNAKKQSLFTIAPHASFLEILANNILDGTLLNGWDISSDFGLSDITIFLPTKKSRLELADIFNKKLNGALLPDIKTFGDEKEEESVFLPPNNLAPFDLEPLPKAISTIRRSLILSKLTQGYLKEKPLSSSQVFALSSSLSSLIDDCHIEDVKIENLKNITPDNLSENWQENLEFLKIAFDVLPHILKEENLIDIALLQKIKLQRQAENLENIYKNKPIIAAGSTGSVLATAKLLKAITKLKRGVVVFPSLDISLSNETLKTLSDKKTNPHSHPQYVLVETLKNLGAKLGDVKELAPKKNTTRTNIIRSSLALMNESANWANIRKKYQDDIKTAFKDISFIGADNDELQARAIAFATYDFLIKNKSVGIISPNRNLARRISVELKRFNIEVDDSAGTPLFHTPIMRFARQVITLVKGNFSSLDLVALLQNKFTHFALSRAEINKRAQWLEYALLRGQNPKEGIDGLRIALKQNLNNENPYAPLKLSEKQGEELSDLFDRLEITLNPLIVLFSNKKIKIAQFANVFERVILDIVKDENDDLKILQNWLQNLSKEDENINLEVDVFDIESSLQSLMANISSHAKTAFNAPVNIWGQLEARLQNKDLMILAGLNETIWPKIADPGVWLSRNMAVELGLEPKEKRIGQAAHDFEMALGNENVIISYAKRKGVDPIQPSRFLQRLSAFIGDEISQECQKKGDIWLEKALNIDFCENVTPALRPSPNPKKALRPKSLSVTEIETLMRSPYDIYAKYILNLKPLDPLGMKPDARNRGNIIHAIFEQFIKEKIDINSKEAFEDIMKIAKENFASLNNPSQEILHFKRFENIAREFIKFEKIRDKEIKKRNAEVKGNWKLNGADPIFTLRGKADRIDILNNGELEILDFKTGSIPDAKDMRGFFAPQMLLEAAMAREGAFKNIIPAKIASLKYIKLSFSPKSFEITDYKFEKNTNLDLAVDKIIERLSRHVHEYLLNDKTPMSARIFPNLNQKFIGNYEHLSRTGEWSLADDLEGE